MTGLVEDDCLCTILTRDKKGGKGERSVLDRGVGWYRGYRGDRNRVCDRVSMGKWCT